jgi:hypothetical protein
MMRNRNGKDLTKIAEAAFNSMADEVVDLAIRTKTTIVLWEDGVVKKVKPRRGMLGLSRRSNPKKTTKTKQT